MYVDQQINVELIISVIIRMQNQHIFNLLENSEALQNKIEEIRNFFESKNGKKEKNDAKDEMSDISDCDSEDLTLEDIFFWNRIINIDEREELKDELLIYLPNDENYLSQLQERDMKNNTETVKTVKDAIKEWEEDKGVKLSWKALGFRTRIDIAKGMRKLNKEHSVFNYIKNDTIIRCDIGKTCIRLSLKRMWKTDQLWHEKMYQELTNEDALFLSEICSITILRRIPKGMKKSNIITKNAPDKQKFEKSNKLVVVSGIPAELVTDYDGKMYKIKDIIDNIKSLLVNGYEIFNESDIIKILFRENKVNNDKIRKNSVQHRAIIILTHKYNTLQFEKKKEFDSDYGKITVERVKSQIYRNYVNTFKPMALVVQCEKCHKFDHYTDECDTFRREKAIFRKKLISENETKENIKQKLKKYRMPPICYKCNNKDTTAHKGKDCKGKTRCINCHKTDHHAKEFKKCDKFKKIASMISVFLLRNFGINWEERWNEIIYKYPNGVCTIEFMTDIQIKQRKEKERLQFLKRKEKKLQLQKIKESNEIARNFIDFLEKKKNNEITENTEEDIESDSDDGKQEEKDAILDDEHNNNFKDTMKLPVKQDVIQQANESKRNNNSEKNDNGPRQRKRKKRKRNESLTEAEKREDELEEKTRDEKHKQELKVEQIKRMKQYDKERQKNITLTNRYKELLQKQNQKYQIKKKNDKDDGNVQAEVNVDTKKHTHTMNSSFNGDTPEINGNMKTNNDNKEKKYKTKRRGKLRSIRRRRTSILDINRVVDDNGNIKQAGSDDYDKENLTDMKNVKKSDREPSNL